MFKPGDAQGCRRPPKAGDGHGVKSPAVLAEGAHASGTLISDVRPPEPRENKCVFSRPPPTPVCGDLLPQTQETNTPRGRPVLPTRRRSDFFCPDRPGGALGTWAPPRTSMWRFSVCAVPPSPPTAPWTRRDQCHRPHSAAGETKAGTQVWLFGGRDSRSPAAPASWQARPGGTPLLPRPPFPVRPLAVLWSLLYDGG